MQIIYIDKITRFYVRHHPEYLFIFGDNDARKGFGGLAREVRGESNSAGIRVKRYPSMSDDSFYNEDDIENQTKNITDDIDAINKRLINYTAIVFPTRGIGTGMAKLEEKSPTTKMFLDCMLKKVFGIENDKL